MKQWLADEVEQKKPEFLKQRPKYFYYYEWMKERICETHPALPELVMDKLLTMPAGDLDLILQHPQATTWKVRFHQERSIPWSVKRTPGILHQSAHVNVPAGLFSLALQHQEASIWKVTWT